MKNPLEAETHPVVKLITDPVGQIVGSLKHVKPARQVVFEMVEEYIDVTSDLASTARRVSPQAQRCVSPMDTGEGEASKRLGALGQRGCHRGSGG